MVFHLNRSGGKVIHLRVNKIKTKQLYLDGYKRENMPTYKMQI